MSSLKPELLQVQLYGINLIDHIDRCTSLIELSKLSTSIRFFIRTATKYSGSETLRARVLTRYRFMHHQYAKKAAI